MQVSDDGEPAVGTASPMGGDRLTLAALDRTLIRPVLVTSERGRDLDLLCRPPERRLLIRSLAQLGYHQTSPRLTRRTWTEQWVRLDDADVVDLNPVDRWGLTPDAVE